MTRLCEIIQDAPVEVRMLGLHSPFPINKKIAGLVPMAGLTDQQAITESIAANGQRIPILIWKGEIVDGRCRQKAITCLDTVQHVLFKTIPDSTPEHLVISEMIAIHNRRSLTTTQKACVASKEYCEHGEALKLSLDDVVRNKRIGKHLLKNTNYIYRNYPKIFEVLFNGGTYRIVDKDGGIKDTSKITPIYAFLKREEEMKAFEELAQELALVEGKPAEELLDYGIDYSTIRSQHGRDTVATFVKYMTDNMPLPKAQTAIGLFKNTMITGVNASFSSLADEEET